MEFFIYSGLLIIACLITSFVTRLHCIDIESKSSMKCYQDGKDYAREDERMKALKAGVGKWIISDKNYGETVFQYGNFTDEKVQKM